MTAPTRLIFSKGKSLFSNAITLFTWSDYSHVELVRGDQVFGANADLGGVSQLPLAQRIAESKRHAFFTTPADPDAVHHYVMSQFGKPYDWDDVLGLMVHHDWRGTSKWMCSELIAWAHLQAGTPLLNESYPFDRVTPQTLLTSVLLTQEMP